MMMMAVCVLPCLVKSYQIHILERKLRSNLRCTTHLIGAVHISACLMQWFYHGLGASHTLCSTWDCAMSLCFSALSSLIIRVRRCSAVARRAFSLSRLLALASS